MSLHLYADDTILYLPFDPQNYIPAMRQIHHHHTITINSDHYDWYSSVLREFHGLEFFLEVLNAGL